uniref:Uncharacterized protein n=1 Tax=Megaselia scalaris TaxID=36166 RepID=T1GIJ9_MEGSC
NTEDTPEGTTLDAETTYTETTTLLPGQSSFSNEVDILIDSNFFEMFESDDLRSSFSCSEGFVCSSETTEVCVRKEEGECSSRCSAECPTNSTTITTKCTYFDGTDIFELLNSKVGKENICRGTI